MNPRNQALIIFCLIVGAVIPAAPAQQPHYTDEDGELKRLILDTMKAGKNKDQAKFDVLVNSMRLPDPQTWFTTTFGPKMGAYFSQGYARWQANAPDDLAGLLSRLANLGFAHADIIRFTNPCDQRADENEYPLLLSRQSPQPLFSVDMVNGNNSRTLKYFTFSDGGFRFVGNLQIPDDMYPLVADLIAGKTLAESAASRLHLAQDVVKSHLINQVPPVYPSEARTKGVQGTVWISATITKDGAVSQAEVVKGRCILATAALNAVRQWRFSPTTSKGAPMEVDTIFKIKFILNGQ